MIRKWMAVLAAVFLAAPVWAGEQPVLTTEKDKMNYGIGVNVMRNFQQQGMEVDLDMVIQGMRDALAGRLLLPEKELRVTMNAYQVELRRKQKQARQQAVVDNKKAGEEFLAANRQKEGVTSLPSGLQYRVLKPGEGPVPKDSDMVEINYRGTLIDGVEFDNTYDTGQPATLKVAEGGGIAGWSEALKLMPVGSKWQLFIPPQLAFGEKGTGRDIGPNATLIFEIELLAIK